MANANTQKTPDYSAFEPYQYAALAARLMAGSDDDKRYVPATLENLLGSKGMNIGAEGLRAMKAFGALDMVDEEGHPDPNAVNKIQRGIMTYAVEFEKARGKLSPADLAGWYMPALNGSVEDKKKINDYLGQYKESSEKIITALAKAQHTLKTPGGISDEEKAKAEGTIKKYNNIMALIQTLDKYKFEDLKGTVVQATRKQELKDLASKLN